jgi:class 3 adenylate cyclase
MRASHDEDKTQHLIRAIAFVDCCGFTSFTAQRGDGAALALYRRLREGLQEEVAPLPVEIVKWMGDGAMLASEDPTAILTCLYRSMVRARDAGSLPIRAGVAVGPVLATTTDGFDYIGMTVNRAAHLCEVARPWQVRLRSEGDEVRYTLLPSDGAGPTWSPWRPDMEPPAA